MVSFSIRVAIADLQSNLRERLEGIKSKLRKYLTYAIYAEYIASTFACFVQPKTILPPCLTKENHYELGTPLENATDEQMIIFFHRMGETFHQRASASRLYGGHLWELIANNGTRLFCGTDTSGCDTTFSLEHNSGSVFNRIPTPFLKSSYKSKNVLKELLDKKFSKRGADFASLRQAIHQTEPDMDLTEPDSLYTTFQSIVGELEKVRSAYSPRSELFTQRFITGVQTDNPKSAET